jgi:hypothetical protein
MTLFGMLTICLDIPQVVETVNRTRNQAKRCEHHQRGPKIIRLQQIVAEENRRKHKHIFEPLQGSEQLDIMNHRAYLIIYLPAKVCFFLELTKIAGEEFNPEDYFDFF